jgi:hypothetical protein
LFLQQFTLETLRSEELYCPPINNILEFAQSSSSKTPVTKHDQKKLLCARRALGGGIDIVVCAAE